MQQYHLGGDRRVVNDDVELLDSGVIRNVDFGGGGIHHGLGCDPFQSLLGLVLAKPGDIDHKSRVQMQVTRSERAGSASSRQYLVRRATYSLGIVR